MQTYIALLRGINVSGQKKIKMAILTESMNSWGFLDTKSYIQSGNLVFKYPPSDIDGLQLKIKSGIADVFGFEVEVLVIESGEFSRLVGRNPFLGDHVDKKQLYYVFTIDAPQADKVREISAEIYEGEEFSITDGCIFLYCHKGYGKAKCNNNFFEKKLKIKATARNYNTVNKLLELTL